MLMSGQLQAQSMLLLRNSQQILGIDVEHFITKFARKRSFKSLQRILSVSSLSHTLCVTVLSACKRYRILGCIFLKPEDLENVRVSSLSSLLICASG
jgi:energy-converting hydrogenase A subunit M